MDNHRKTHKLLSLFAVALLTACATHRKEIVLSDTVGPWENLYKGDPALAGIYVIQYPEGAVSFKDYEHKHPGLIEYFFGTEELGRSFIDLMGAFMMTSGGPKR